MSKSFLNSPNLVRGLRNNNPGNLVRTNIAWQGKVPHPQNTDAKFEQFTNVMYGLRAMIKDLINDISKGKNTVKLLITEYAPPSENNTAVYVNSVAKTLGVDANAKISTINAKFILNLVRAILKVELGASHAQITDSDVLEAVDSLGDVSTSTLKVDTTVTVSIIKKFMLPILITVGLFFCTYVTLITI